MTDVDWTLEKLNNLKPLISRNEELYISKEDKKEILLHHADKYPASRGASIFLSRKIEGPLLAFSSKA